MSVPKDGQNIPPQLDTNMPIQGETQGAGQSMFFDTVSAGGSWPQQAFSFGPGAETMGQFPSNPFGSPESGNPQNPRSPFGDSDSEDEITRGSASSLANYMERNPGGPITPEMLASAGIQTPNATTTLEYGRDSLSIGSPGDLPTPMGDTKSSSPGSSTRSSTTDAPQPPGSPEAPKPTGEGTRDGSDKLKDQTIEITKNKDEANVVINDKGQIVGKDGRPYQKEPKDNADPSKVKVFVETGADDKAQEQAYASLSNLKNYLAAHREANLQIPSTLDEFKQQLKSATSESSGAGGSGSSGGTGGEGGGGCGGGGGGSGGGGGGSGGGGSGGGDAGSSGGETPKGGAEQPSGPTPGGDNPAGGTKGRSARQTPLSAFSEGTREAARSIASATDKNTAMNHQALAGFATSLYSPKMMAIHAAYKKLDANGDGKIDEKEMAAASTEDKDALAGEDNEKAQLAQRVKDLSDQNPEAKRALDGFASQIIDHRNANSQIKDPSDANKVSPQQVFHDSIASLASKTNGAKPMGPEAAEKAYKADLDKIFPDKTDDASTASKALKAVVAAGLINSIAKFPENELKPDEKAVFEPLIKAARSLQDGDPKKIDPEALTIVRNYLHKMAN